LEGIFFLFIFDNFKTTKKTKQLIKSYYEFKKYF
jgi:hypothetical protein